MNRFTKTILILVGSISLGLGVLGIFLPLLPTTPFLLLAAACYSKSSDKFYNKLINNKMLGRFIKNYREGKGIPLRGKVLSITMLWLAIGYSVILAGLNLIIRILLLIIAVGVTVHILRIKTSEKKIH
ncbi:YbaN family protein [Petroclostridium sp. X23]|uniref:YbaN family protein n=1 Tax=Petroclostridium sp. X23 TaxID=3045146 RepID=UPI0024ADFDBB|nr:YbaN family protein [Petroclostridium sp. X23]WHH57854.1 YbaN family protein [Petroclostridium sp. X23]